MGSGRVLRVAHPGWSWSRFTATRFLHAHQVPGMRPLTTNEEVNDLTFLDKTAAHDILVIMLTHGPQGCWYHDGGIVCDVADCCF